MIVSVRVRRVLLDGVEPDELSPSELARVVERELQLRLDGAPKSGRADQPATTLTRAGSEIAAAVHARLPARGGPA
jgi:hypothetical protein